MKRFILVLSILFIEIGLYGQGIEFVQGMTSWDEVLERSKTEMKPIFVDIYTEWCGPCKWMDQNVFNQQEVGTYMNQHFINIKLDAEKGWGPSFKSTFGVAAYPTYLFFDPEGNMVFNTGGSKPAEKFLSLSQRAIDNWKSGISSKKLQNLLNNKKDPEGIKSVLGKLRERPQDFISAGYIP